MTRTLLFLTLLLSAHLCFSQQALNAESLILTPDPPKTPRINGAKTFGVRPGHPFIYTIAATGDRPMAFSAGKLPQGLKLDAATGRITGSINTQGTYIVTLYAKNNLGRTSRQLKIVCGDRLALTPPMGWSAWNYLWDHPTDKDIRAAADAMVSTGLINHGYSYINIDDCWGMKKDAKDPLRNGEARDAAGNLVPNRYFPGMKALTDYIHEKGLKAGIYISPGPTTCGGYPGSINHEEQDAQTFARWGFDYLKYDWCSYGDIAGYSYGELFSHKPLKDTEALKKPYYRMGAILKKLDRDMVMNICIALGNVWEWGEQVGGQSWRTGLDLNLNFDNIPKSFGEVFDLYAPNEVQQYSGPGAWNDLDFLQVGYIWNGRKSKPQFTPFSHDEQYAHMSFWCLQSSPLILGCDITRLDPFTLGLLTNDEVLDIDQDPQGKGALRVSGKNGLEVWVKDLYDGSKAVGLFNRTNTEAVITADWKDAGLKGKLYVRDLWRQKNLGMFKDKFETSVPAHGVVLVRMAKKMIRN